MTCTCSRLVRMSALTECCLLALVLTVLGVASARSQEIAAPRPLGTMAVLSGPTPCEGEECFDIQVTCPEVAAQARGRLKVGAPESSTRKGTILLTTGGLGTGLYVGGESPRIVKELRASGFRTVQLQWADSWLIGSPGKKEGHVRLACRPATVARWVFDHLHDRSPSTAFCASGHSGGSAQVSYMLSHYGLEEILAAVVPTGGPPMARMDLSCARDDPANASLAYPDWATRIIDAGFGFLAPGDPASFNPFVAPASGPCAAGDASFAGTLRQSSVASGEGDYVYPRTMVWFVFEGIDDTHAVAMGMTYYDLLMRQGSPLVGKDTIPDVAHGGRMGLYASREGANRIRDVLINECRPR